MLGVNPSHMGIYLGKGRFAHVGENTGAIIISLNHPYFHRRYAGARRVER